MAVAPSTSILGYKTVHVRIWHTPFRPNVRLQFSIRVAVSRRKQIDLDRAFYRADKKCGSEMKSLDQGSLPMTDLKIYFLLNIPRTMDPGN